MPAFGARLGEIEALYRSHFERFLRVATAIVADEELALDAVQDGFAGAIRSRARFRGDGPLEAWLFRAVVNSARSIWRAQPLVAAAMEHASGNGTADAGELRAWIALLPERQRLAVFLRYYADLDYQAIAAVLGVSTGTVAATLNAARASLRQAANEEVRG